MEQIFFTLCIWFAVGLQTSPVHPAGSEAVRELYARAATAIGSGEPQAAIEPLESLVAASPESAVTQIAVVHLAECYVHASRFKEAADVLRTWSDRIGPQAAAVAIDPNLVEHHARVWLRAAHHVTDDQQAIDSLTELNKHLETLIAQADSPVELKATLLLTCREQAKRYVKTGQVAQATQLLEKCSESPAAAIEELLVLQILREKQLNAPEEAQKKLKELALHQPLTRRTAEARLELASTLIQEEQLSEAIDLLEPLKSHAEFGSDFQCRFWLLASEAELARGDAQQAVAVLPSDEELQGLSELQQTVIRFARAEAFAQAQDRAAALRELTWLSDHSQQQTASWAPAVELRRCEILLSEKRYVELEQAADGAKKSFPSFDKVDEFEYLQARAAIQQVNFERARGHLQAIVESLSKPERARPIALARAQWMLGEVDFFEQKYESAITAYSIVIDNSTHQPWRTLALLQTGKCFELLRKEADALAAYERVMAETKDEKLRGEANARITVVKQVADVNAKAKLRR